jgi:hypothetical protein
VNPLVFRSISSVVERVPLKHRRHRFESDMEHARRLKVIRQNVKNQYSSDKNRDKDEQRQTLREVTPATQTNQGQRLREEEKKEEK